MLVIFDCDGVLVDSEMIAARIESEELTRIGYLLTWQENLRLFVGKSQKSMINTVEETFGHPVPEGFEKHLSKRVQTEIRNALLPIQGVSEILSRISFKCVASSGEPDKILNSLRVTGLESYFQRDRIFSAVEVEHGKPSPDLFLHVAEKMNMDPSCCLVIEDSLAGVQAAHAAGMRVYGFLGGSHILDFDYARTQLLDAGAEMIFDDMPSLGKEIGL